MNGSHQIACTCVRLGVLDVGSNTARLLIVGPPGAGKGTQAARIGERFGIPTISTGDIFRLNIANETDLGKQVKAIVDAVEAVTKARHSAQSLAIFLRVIP